MNFTDLQLKRRSVRHYQNKPLNEKDINKLKEVINASPTSMNGQQFSAIFIQDEQSRKAISDITGGQKHILEAPLFILFLADFNRIEAATEIYNTNNKLDKKLEITTDTIDSLLYSFVDATIAAQSTVDAAISLDISTCFIGAIRRNAKAVQKLLNLPKYVLPVVGLTIGYSSNLMEIKPKINKVYDEKYDAKLVIDEILKYDEITKVYYNNHRDNNNSYTKNTISKYHFFINSPFMGDLHDLWPNNWLIKNKKDAK